MRLLSPILDKVTDPVIARLYPNTKFVSDYQPYRNSKIYYNPEHNSYIAQFSNYPKWINGHRVIDRFWQYNNKYIAPFAVYNTIVYPDGKTIIFNKNKQNVWKPDVYIGRNKLSIQNISYNKTMVIFDYGIIKRRVKLTHLGVKDDYIITDFPDSFVKVVPNYTSKDIPSNPYYLNDARGKHFPLITDGENKYIPLPMFDIMKFPVEFDDDFTASLTDRYNTVADCDSIDKTNYFDSNNAPFYVGTSFTSDVSWYQTLFSFNDDIQDTILSAQLTVNIWGDDNGSTYLVYLNNNNIGSFNDGVDTATLYTFNFDVKNNVSGQNDAGYIDFSNCDGYFGEVDSVNLIIEYSAQINSFGSNI
jgi:hypothetical protein